MQKEKAVNDKKEDKKTKKAKENAEAEANEENHSENGEAKTNEVRSLPLSPPPISKILYFLDRIAVQFKLIAGLPLFPSTGGRSR